MNQDDQIAIHAALGSGMFLLATDTFARLADKDVTERMSISADLDDEWLARSEWHTNRRFGGGL